MNVMPGKHLLSLSDAIEIIEFTESIENRIQSLQSQVAGIKIRSIGVIILVSCIVLGVSFRPFVATPNESFSLNFSSNAFIVSCIAFFSLIIIFGAKIYAENILSEYRRIKKQLAKERVFLSKFVGLADHAISEIKGAISPSQQALLEIRLQRITFERL